MERIVKANDREYNEKFLYKVSKIHIAHTNWGGSYLKIVGFIPSRTLSSIKTLLAHFNSKVPYVSDF